MTTIPPTFDDFVAWLEGIRPAGPVQFDEKLQCWQVLGHPEATAVLSDPAVFSSDLTAIAPDQEDFALFQRGNFVRMDPPQHRKLRTLVSQAFTPKVVAGLEPRIAELTTDLLDRTGERFDLIDALAYPLPVVVIAELLGIPASDRQLFRTWADVLLSQEIDPDQAVGEASERAVAAVVPTMREMNAYFLDHIQAIMTSTQVTETASRTPDETRLRSKPARPRCTAVTITAIAPAPNTPITQAPVRRRPSRTCPRPGSAAAAATAPRLRRTPTGPRRCASPHQVRRPTEATVDDARSLRPRARVQ